MKYFSEGTRLGMLKYGRVINEDFKESDHPRDEAGKFSISSSERASIHFVTTTHKSGKHAGAGEFMTTYDPDTKSSFLHPVQVYTEDEYQRQGVASAMYRYIEEKTGLKIRPSSKQTPEGAAFSAHRK